jgi:hypothetical protein
VAKTKPKLPRGQSIYSTVQHGGPGRTPGKGRQSKATSKCKARPPWVTPQSVRPTYESLPTNQTCRPSKSQHHHRQRCNGLFALNRKLLELRTPPEASFPESWSTCMLNRGLCELVQLPASPMIGFRHGSTTGTDCILSSRPQTPPSILSVSRLPFFYLETISRRCR